MEVESQVSRDLGQEESVESGLQKIEQTFNLQSLLECQCWGKKSMAREQNQTQRI